MPMVEQRNAGALLEIADTCACAEWIKTQRRSLSAPTGLEPGFTRWQRLVITLHYRCRVFSPVALQRHSLGNKSIDDAGTLGGVVPDGFTPSGGSALWAAPMMITLTAYLLPPSEVRLQCYGLPVSRARGRIRMKMIGISEDLSGHEQEVKGAVQGHAEEASDDDLGRRSGAITGPAEA